MFFDDLIDIITLENLFAPLSAWVQDRLQGPSVFFGLPSMQGYSKRQVGRVLGNAGVRHWGLMYDGRYIILSVAKSDVLRAHSALADAGMSVLWPKK